MEDGLIAMFELTVDEDEQVKIIEEKLYTLVPGDKISAADLQEYNR